MPTKTLSNGYPGKMCSLRQDVDSPTTSSSVKRSVSFISAPRRVILALNVERLKAEIFSSNLFSDL